MLHTHVQRELGDVELVKVSTLHNDKYPRVTAKQEKQTGKTSFLRSLKEFCLGVPQSNPQRNPIFLHKEP